MLITDKKINGMMIKKTYKFQDNEILDHKAIKRQKIRELSSDGNQFNSIMAVVIQLVILLTKIQF